MLPELILCCLVLRSSAAIESCDNVEAALNGYAKHKYGCDFTSNVLNVTGTASPEATLNKIQSVTNVTILEITSLLSHVTVDAFDNLNDLSSIWLEDNAIERLPEKIFSKLTSLEDLYLGGNRIESTVNFTELPRSLIFAWFNDNLIRRLAGIEDIPPALTHLDLNGNQLTSFVMDPTGRPYDLDSLNLTGNRITEYYTPGLSRLQSLDLDRNLLTRVPSDMLAGLTALDDLHLHGNRIEAIEEGAFLHAPALTLLDLSDNLVRVLGDNIGLPGLSHLALNGNRIQYLDAKLFVRSLTKLELVAIHDNPFHCGSLEDLLKLIASFGGHILCRQLYFNGTAPACVVHSRENVHHCSNRYRLFSEKSPTYFSKRY